MYDSRHAFAVSLLLAIGLPAQAQDTIKEHLEAIDALNLKALHASRAAESAYSVGDVKSGADTVFQAVWGQPSGLPGDTIAAVATYGWKTRWQTDGTAFDKDHVERHGSEPPAVTDPAQLGIIGRGRRVRALLQTLLEDPSTESSQRTHASHVIASLNNVIGWMRLDDGITKAELQPRVDLTYVWDAPSEFWNTTADTGWLHEAFSQAVNILKTDYAGDLELARSHAADMTALLEKCRSGVDHDGNGSIAPVMMEGGLTTAFEHAGYGGMLQ